MGYILINLKMPALAPSSSFPVKLHITNMKHQVLLGFDVIKSIGLYINPVLETISWNKQKYSYSSTSSIPIPELEAEDRFEVLEASNFSIEAVDSAVNRSVLQKKTADRERLEQILLN